jgi:hypothetical protein
MKHILHGTAAIASICQWSACAEASEGHFPCFFNFFWVLHVYYLVSIPLSSRENLAQQTQYVDIDWQ